MTAGTSTNATRAISAAESAATPIRRAAGLTSSGRGGTGRPASSRASRRPISSAAASISVASIACVGGREAVDAPLLEPLRPGRASARRASRPARRSAAVQPRRGERAPVVDELGAARRLGSGGRAPLCLHRFAGGTPEPFRQILREVDVAGLRRGRRMERAAARMPAVPRPGCRPTPRGRPEWVTADAAVARRDERRRRSRARRRDAVDRGRCERRGRRRARPPPPRPRGERGEPAAERRAGPALPVRAVDRALRADARPATTTTSSTPCSRSSTAGRSSRCFGAPNRVAAPAARTTAPIRSSSTVDVLDHDRL